MLYWKGRHGYSPSELVTVCEKCHTPANHKKNGKLYGFGEDIEFADLSGAAFMNAVRWQVVEQLKSTLGDDFVSTTYGAMTKEQRRLLNVEKSHNNDAFVMGEFHPSDRCAFEYYTMYNGWKKDILPLSYPENGDYIYTVILGYCSGKMYIIDCDDNNPLTFEELMRSIGQ